MITQVLLNKFSFIIFFRILLPIRLTNSLIVTNYYAIFLLNVTGKTTTIYNIHFIRLSIVQKNKVNKINTNYDKMFAIEYNF